MVLCPFVFLWTRSDSPTLKLQPTEVASTHWVPLRTLLSPSSRTAEYVDITERYIKRAGYLSRLAVRSILGYMQFSAIKLTPTESLCCSSIPEFFPTDYKAQHPQSSFQRWSTWCSGNDNRPLLLWGLTLGVLADFLDMLPPHNAVQLWEYPTFTAPDLQLILHILTYRLRKRNMLQVTSGARPNNTAVDGQTAAIPVPEAEGSNHENNEVGIGGLGVGGYSMGSEKDSEQSSYAVGVMLRGYYERVRVAIPIFLAWRVALSTVAGAYAWKLLRHR